MIYSKESKTSILTTYDTESEIATHMILLKRHIETIQKGIVTEINIDLIDKNIIGKYIDKDILKKG